MKYCRTFGASRRLRCGADSAAAKEVAQSAMTSISHRRGYERFKTPSTGAPCGRASSRQAPRSDSKCAASHQPVHAEMKTAARARPFSRLLAPLPGETESELEPPRRMR